MYSLTSLVALYTSLGDTEGKFDYRRLAGGRGRSISLLPLMMCTFTFGLVDITAAAEILFICYIKSIATISLKSLAGFPLIITT